MVPTVGRASAEVIAFRGRARIDDGEARGIFASTMTDTPARSRCEHARAVLLWASAVAPRRCGRVDVARRRRATSCSR
jgi:hypothetical protein